MAELKNCPFCGGKGKLSRREKKFIGYNILGTAKMIEYAYQVICNRCHARGGIVTSINSPNAEHHNSEEQTRAEEEAIELWNKRA